MQMGDIQFTFVPQRRFEKDVSVHASQKHKALQEGAHILRMKRNSESDFSGCSFPVVPSEYASARQRVSSGGVLTFMSINTESVRVSHPLQKRTDSVTLQFYIIRTSRTSLQLNSRNSPILRLSL